MKNLLLSTSLLLGFYSSTSAQTIAVSAETKQTIDTTQGHTTIGGYGNAYFQRDNNEEKAKMNFERLVLFTGHKFNKKFSFFSELEVEDAKVSGGEEGGEVALEQCYIQYNVNATNYWKFGLFIPQIGLLNQNHLPENFNGNERSIVETIVIPSTWRELGISYIGEFSKVPVSYSIALMNGLSSANFEHGTGIRGGRFEGRDATGNNLALTGAIEYAYKKIKFQVSGYYGGSVGLSKREADKLQLESGIFGSAVGLLEANFRYTTKNFSFKALACTISIPKAASINRAYLNNTADLAYGGSVEAAYVICRTKELNSSAHLIGFARFEKLDLNADIPGNALKDPTLDQQHLIIGLTYLPLNNLVFKFDVRIKNTGNPNPELAGPPDPELPPYKSSNSFVNLGLGFSF